ncbi:MAG: hypothetical protein ACO3KD_04435 [Gaiellales bacterium]
MRGNSAITGRIAAEGARAAYGYLASGRTLHVLGQSRVRRGGITGALVAKATRRHTIDTAADLGGLTFAQVIDHAGTGMRTGIDFAIQQFATDAAVRADVTRIVRAGADERALERQLVRDAAWRGAARGAVSGVPAVVPFMGTTVELGAAVADSIALTAAETRLILALEHLRGLDLAHTDRRRLDVLVILALAAGSAEIDERAQAIRVAGRELTLDMLRDEELPHETVVALGASIGADIVRRIARRRTAGFIMRLMPGGVSIAAAAWIDYRLTGEAGRQAIRYLDLVHPVRTP